MKKLRKITDCKIPRKTPLMEFFLVKLQAYSVRTAFLQCLFLNVTAAADANATVDAQMLMPRFSNAPCY